MIDADGNIADKIGNNLKTITIKNIYGDDYEGQVPDEITIQYEDGMTWEEFVNSDYNINDSINIDSENRITIREYDGCVVSSQLDDERRKEETSFQIDSNREYYFTLLG